MRHLTGFSPGYHIPTKRMTRRLEGGAMGKTEGRDALRSFTLMVGNLSQRNARNAHSYGKDPPSSQTQHSTNFCTDSTSILCQ